MNCPICRNKVEIKETERPLIKNSYKNYKKNVELWNKNKNDIYIKMAYHRGYIEYLFIN